MRSMFRKNDGYTLVELMVTLIAGSLVTLAALTVLLLCVRINRQSVDTSSRQMTTRILLSSLEDLATQGTISKVESGPDFWKIYGRKNNVENQLLYSFDSASQTIYSGDAASETAIMEGVFASSVALEGKLLSFAVETEDGSYASTVYCRTVVQQTVDQETDQILPTVPEDNTPQPGDPANVRFLQILASQYVINGGNGVELRNPGLILHNGVSTGEYFSQWYIGGGWGKDGWNANTPWCACFISWGLDQVWTEYHLPGKPPREANVDNFMYYLKANTNGHKWKPAGGDPSPGDLIFFDWKVNGIQDPEHIGTVIDVIEETVNGQTVKFVYTLEGNSANRVAVRKYSVGDPRIIGYGVLNWSAAS